MREKLRDPDYVHGKRWLVLLVLCVSLIVIILDNTILNVALPTLAKGANEGGLDASQSQLQWIVDSYTIVFAGLLLTAGSMGDRFGRYKGLTFGLAVFGVGSALSAFAGSASVLIGTRAIMGIGGAFIMPATLSILTNVFRDPDERRKAIGIWAGVSALGLGVGPITGGTLLAHFWWGSVFLINVPVVIIGLIAGYFLIPESKDPSKPRLDPVGAVLSIVGLGTVLWAVIEAPEKGWPRRRCSPRSASVPWSSPAFFIWELRSTHPMLDMKLFKNPRFSAASAAITLTFLALFGIVFLLTPYLQTVLGLLDGQGRGAPAADVRGDDGARSDQQHLGAQVGQPRRGRHGHGHRGGRRCSSTRRSRSARASGSSSRITVLMGAGMANIMAPATDSIMGSLPRAKAGVGSAVNDTTRQVGGAVGVAVLGSVLASRYSSHIDSLLGGKAPAPLVDQVGNSIGRAVVVVENVPQAKPFAPQIMDAAKQSYVAGFHTASLVAAAVLLVGMVIVIKFLPARHLEEAPAVRVRSPRSASPRPNRCLVPRRSPPSTAPTRSSRRRTRRGRDERIRRRRVARTGGTQP